MTARQRFLARGHFSALANELADTTLAFLDSSGRTPGRPCTVLDVGCGSGYYLGVLAERLRETFSPTTCLLGMDVSRDALRIAGRAVPRAVFFLNDVRHRICAADASVDVLWNVFAPRNPAEFARVTRPGGLAVIVTPTEAHLREVAEYAPVIGMAPDKRESVAAALAPHFVETGATSLEYGMSLSGTDLVDLLLMTPNARHLSAEALERVAEVPAARITAAFDVLRFERRGG